MGYYTNYTLDWTKKDMTLVSSEETKKINDYIRVHDYFGVYEDGGGMGECKWYDHVEDMLLMSKTFPDILFTLNGVGEEPGDFWNKYFLNDRYQEAVGEIVYPPFDESKLK